MWSPVCEKMQWNHNMDTAAEVGVSAWYILVASHLHRDTGSVDVTAVCDSAQTVISYAWNLHNWVIIVMHGHAAVSFPCVQSLGQTTFIKCNLCTVQSQMCTIISHSAGRLVPWNTSFNVKHALLTHWLRVVVLLSLLLLRRWRFNGFHSHFKGFLDWSRQWYRLFDQCWARKNNNKNTTMLRSAILMQFYRLEWNRRRENHTAQLLYPNRNGMVWHLAVSTHTLGPVHSRCSRGVGSLIACDRYGI